ncbi:hypothetical protein FGE03_24855 [Escherichia coli]|nr:hypothetical protein [Salmonella enterica]EFD1012235.1 hypothetical protein [Escherichia coli]EFX0809819.1 hypothetical protein [Shigella sonnei]MBD6208948.1 hypothetical protein [Salmonella enterica subsp. enterica serovar Enteritidis]EBH1757213.1 hypothetical protein [Salmonella enterica]
MSPVFIAREKFRAPLTVSNEQTCHSLTSPPTTKPVESSRKPDPFTITPVARTAKTRSVRSRQQTGKTSNKPPEKLPRSRLVNFNLMHSYARN